MTARNIDPGLNPIAPVSVTVGSDGEERQRIDQQGAAYTGETSPVLRSVTVQPIGRARNASETPPPCVYTVTASLAANASGTTTTINVASHSAQRGDLVAGETGANVGESAFVESTTATSIILAQPFSAASTSGSTYVVRRLKQIPLDSTGLAVSIDGSVDIASPVAAVNPGESDSGVVTRAIGEFSYTAGGEFDPTYTYRGVGGYSKTLAERRPLPLSNDGEAVIVSSNISSISDGRKTVTTAGTRVTLVSSATPCKKVDIQALSTNSAVVVVGGSTCVASASTRQGIALNPNDSYSLEIDDVSKVYIDSVVSGEGVSFVYTL